MIAVDMDQAVAVPELIITTMLAVSIPENNV